MTPEEMIAELDRLKPDTESGDSILAVTCSVVPKKLGAFFISSRDKSRLERVTYCLDCGERGIGIFVYDKKPRGGGAIWWRLLSMHDGSAEQNKLEAWMQQIEKVVLKKITSGTLGETGPDIQLPPSR